MKNLMKKWKVYSNENKPLILNTNKKHYKLCLIKINNILI